MFGYLFSAAMLLLLSLSTQAASVWQVSKGDNILYIGGTIHLLSEQDYPLPAAFDKAYEKADTLVFETDIATMNSPEYQQKTMSLVMLSDGKTIKDFISDKTFNALQQHLQQRGIPVQNFMQFKPGFLAITLSVIELQIMGISSAGVDMYYSAKGVGDNKKIDWFETPDEQLLMLANLGKGEEDSMIAYTLEDTKTVKEMMPKMMAAWRTGDMDALAEIGINEFKQEYPAVYRELLVDRNRNWLPKLTQMIDSAPTELVLVGALHLAGPESVLAMLEAKGYTVEKFQ